MICFDFVVISFTEDTKADRPPRIGGRIGIFSVQAVEIAYPSFQFLAFLFFIIL